ncbi:MAG TPA: 4-(cytidine 5'-diphospho)-2-C-methyl-D-erythritol kinase, partial [Treponema sp.]|nr:4-(cytidine 5'-diphospho)-2-C-methyl-D-erythritol kinase [Treponema sp.]
HAINLFREHTGIQTGLHLFLDKQIPSGAGLGGGSSDAATTLVALNRLFDAGLSDAVLHALACRIGSDVPFFLGSPAALVQGRGELLTAIQSRNDLYGVIIWPEVHCSTAEAYSLVDIWQTEHPDDVDAWPSVESLAAVYAGPLAGWAQFANSFTAPIEARYPLIRTAREALLQEGALFAEMSGSGSSVFGLFGDKQEAELAFSRLSIRWAMCRKILLLAHSPMR